MSSSAGRDASKTVDWGSVRAITLALIVVFSMPVGVSIASAHQRATATAANQLSLASCTEITEPGTYYLEGDVISETEGTCIVIAASDVILDGQGHTIASGTEQREGTGIAIRDTFRNNTVRDLTISGWDNAIKVGDAEGDGVTDSTIADSTVRNNTVGLLINHGSNIVIRNNTVASNERGISLTTVGNTFRGNTIRNNTWSIYGDTPRDVSGKTTFVGPDLGFENATLTLELRNVALRPVAVGDRPTLPAGKEDIGVYLNATNTTTAGAMDIGFEYETAAIQGLQESTLSVWRHNGTWSDRAGSLDTDTNTLRKNITQFSVFAPLADNRTIPVDIDATNSPITEGAALTVTASVQNTGDVAATQEVSLSVGGEVRDRAEIALDPDESRQVTLSWATGSGDAGNYTATVISPHDSDTTSVIVLDSQNFSTTIDATNAPVTEGDDLTVTATVENTGDEAATREVTLSVGGEVRDSGAVALEPDQRESVTLTWQTGSGDAGNYTASVRCCARNNSADDEGASAAAEVMIVAGDGVPGGDLGQTLQENPGLLRDSDVPGSVKSALSGKRLNVVIEGGETIGVVTDDSGSIASVQEGGIDNARYRITVSEPTATEISETNQPIDRAVSAYRNDELSVEVGSGPSGLDRLVTSAKLSVGKLVFDIGADDLIFRDS